MSDNYRLEHSDGTVFTKDDVHSSEWTIHRPDGTKIEIVYDKHPINPLEGGEFITEVEESRIFCDRGHIVPRQRWSSVISYIMENAGKITDDALCELRLHCEDHAGHAIAEYIEKHYYANEKMSYRGLVIEFMEHEFDNDIDMQIALDLLDTVEFGYHHGITKGYSQGDRAEFLILPEKQDGDLANFEEVAENMVKVIGCYLWGDVYGFTTTKNGEEIESSWGYYGDDHRESGLAENAGLLEQEILIIEG